MVIRSNTVWYKGIYLVIGFNTVYYREVYVVIGSQDGVLQALFMKKAFDFLL